MNEVFLMDGQLPLNNVMLDLETWGTAPGSALRSIGAVEFDPHSDAIGETFYANIVDKSCFDAGLIKDAGTAAWWSRQTRQAQDGLLVDQRPLMEVADNFHQWFRSVRGMFVWSQGANFDQPLWEAAVSKVGLRAPWKYTNSRCTRTAYDMGGLSYDMMPRRSGTYHNALDDAIHQARCVQLAYRRRSA